jgi:hypothetical protein
MASMGIALRDQTNEVTDVPLLDLVDAFSAPMSSHITTEQV